MQIEYHTTTTTTIIRRTVYAQYSYVWKCWQIQIDIDNNGSLSGITRHLMSLTDIEADRVTANEIAKIVSDTYTI